MIRLLLPLACILLAAPAMADTQFRVRKMTRNDVPLGQGQCDIRVQVDGEAEVSVRGDTAFIRTISGRGGGRGGWNDTVEFRGRGRGSYRRERERPLNVYEVDVRVDRGGKVSAVFNTEGGSPLTFSGFVTNMQGDTLTADLVAGDQT